MSFRSLPATVLALVALTLPSGHAKAADAFDNCTGFIDSLPVVISTQGVWCLRQNLATAVTFGNAIDVQTNNVTIECNGFKVGNLGAGTASIAVGISAESRRNITVRGCNFRGFGLAVAVGGTGSGHIVEDNRTEGALLAGIMVQGDNGVVRRNLVLDVGPSTFFSDYNAAGIAVTGTTDVIDNTVSFVHAAGEGSAAGIYGGGTGALFRGNRVREVTAPAGVEQGIVATGGMSVRDNDLLGRGTAGSIGVVCPPGVPVAVRDNTVGGYEANLGACAPALDNLTFDHSPEL